MTSVNIPKLRFPEFSGKWEKKKLGELGNFIGGGTPSTKNIEFWNGNIPWISSSDLSDESINEIKTTRFINEQAVRNSATKLIPKNSILIVSRVGVGKIAINEKELCTSQDFTSLIPNHEYHHIFLAYFLKIKTNRLLEFNQGTSIKGFVKSDLETLQMEIPSLPEQQKIAFFLTAVDEKLQALKKKKSLIEQYKKGMMQKIFSQELRFKDDVVNAYPEWEVKKLGEVTFKVDKKNKQVEQFPIYSISNQNGFVPQSEQFEGLDSNDRGYDISLYKIVEKNTFAYNPARINVGSIGYSGSEIDRVIVSSLYVCFKTVSEINDQFFLFYLQTEHFKNLVIKKGEGGVRIYLFYENFSEITISLPSLPEQTKIANFLSAIDDKIQLVQGQVEKMEAWKKGLLQKMFV